MIKTIIPLVLLCLILAACGEPRAGDIFRLERNTIGGQHIDSMNTTISKMRSLQEMVDPVSVEEHVDLSEINTFSTGTVVRVIEISDNYNMVQIERITPNPGNNVKMWVERDKLNAP
ncbi:hypothetical protein SAMN05216238_101388 [Lentibacillus persicus]|uniref:Uncharacterized protein n=1 Tax=Lentibacillus persicus TaxID=640948 RepID=A0A1I1SLU3_9BACI|nr:hypothetical protein [Lentibacillus persicus]SFD44853.1 hypothetical protein SAMN05216238_101388 [Lentibacillus persicus]